MKVQAKHIIIGAAVVGIGAFAVSAIRAKGVSDAMQVGVKAKTPSIGLNGLMIPLTVTLTNPKGARLKITKPFVELRQKDTDPAPFAVSDVGGQEVVVPPFGSVSFDVSFLIPLLTLASQAAAIFRQAKAEGKITVHIRAKSYASILGVNIPSEQNQYIDIAMPDTIKRLLGQGVAGLGQTNHYAYASTTKQTA